MSRRYYPGTRERLTRALDEGAKHPLCVGTPYSFRNSGRPLHSAFIRGQFLQVGINRSRFPVVDLSAEFADVIRDVEADPPKCLERAA